MNYWIDILQSRFGEQEFIILIIAIVIFFVSLFFIIILSSIFNPVNLRLRREINSYQPYFFTRYSLADKLRKHNDLFIPSDLSLLKRTSQRLDYAGFHSSNSLLYYYALRMTLMLFLPVLIIVLSKIFVFTYSENTLELIIAGLAFGYLLPSFVLDRLIIKRQKILERSFPDALDMIVICSEAGLSLDAALQKVASVLTISHPELAAEFAVIQKEQYELFAAKMMDYGLGNIALGSTLEDQDDINLSITGIWLRCNDKINRLKNILKRGGKNYVAGEAAIDSFIDISNYGIIAQLVMRGKWK